MKVRLTRKLAESIDGVDLGEWRVGDVFEVPASAARLLLAEGWAIIESVAHEVKRHSRQDSRPVGGEK